MNIPGRPEPQRFENQNTVVHLAILEGCPTMIEAAVSQGANSDDFNGDGDSPLHLAIKERSLASVDALIGVGAFLDAIDANGRTPLHLAAEVADAPEYAARLIEAGARLDSRDDEGRTPLHLAVGVKGGQGVVAALLGAGADPCAEDDAGDKPLHSMVIGYLHDNLDAFLGCVSIANDRERIAGSTSAPVYRVLDDSCRVVVGDIPCLRDAKVIAEGLMGQSGGRSKLFSVEDASGREVFGIMMVDGIPMKRDGGG